MDSPLHVTGIDHVVFHVKDLARAKKFYVDFLGLEIKRNGLAAFPQVRQPRHCAI